MLPVAFHVQYRHETKRKTTGKNRADRKKWSFFSGLLGAGYKGRGEGGIIGRYLLRESSLSRDKGLAVLLAWGGDYLLKRIIGFQLATIVVQVS